MTEKDSRSPAPSREVSPHVEGRWCDDLHCMKCYGADTWQKSRIADLELELADLKHDIERSLGFANQHVNEMQRISDWVDERTVNATGAVREILEDLRHELDADQQGES